MSSSWADHGCARCGRSPTKVAPALGEPSPDIREAMADPVPIRCLCGAEYWSDRAEWNDGGER